MVRSMLSVVGNSNPDRTHTHTLSYMLHLVEMNHVACCRDKRRYALQVKQKNTIAITTNNGQWRMRRRNLTREGKEVKKTHQVKTLSGGFLVSYFSFTCPFAFPAAMLHVCMCACVHLCCVCQQECNTILDNHDGM